MNNLKNQLLTIIDYHKEQGRVCRLPMDWQAVRDKIEKRTRFILSPREKRVIELLAENKNYREIGVLFNVTRERIRQIEARIWRKVVAKKYYFQGNKVSIWQSKDGLEGFIQIPSKGPMSGETFYTHYSAKGATVKEVLDELKAQI